MRRRSGIGAPLLAMALAGSAAGCSDGRDASTRQGPGAALTIAQAHADTHYPKGAFQPEGAALDYVVKDARDVWIVDLSPQGYLGGGLEVFVRKRDMKVISALRTR